MKTVYLVLAFGLLASFALGAAESTNLVPNPGFEGKGKSGSLAGWELVSDKQYRALTVVSPDNSVKASGEACAKLHNLKRHPSTVGKEKFSCSYLNSAFISVDKTKTYFVQAKIKTSQPMKGMRVRGFVELYDDKGHNFASAIFDFTQASDDGWVVGEKTISDWDALNPERQFKWTKGMVKVSVGCFIDEDQPADMSVWVDDVQLVQR